MRGQALRTDLKIERILRAALMIERTLKSSNLDNFEGSH
jgi:hypothetical protein